MALFFICLLLPVPIEKESGSRQLDPLFLYESLLSADKTCCAFHEHHLITTSCLFLLSKSFDNDKRDYITTIGIRVDAKNMPPKKVAAKDWDRHRSTITRLYYDEKKHLPEVMAIMESEYKFSASDKMYKTKLKEWELKKNISGPEAVCIYRMKRKRDAVGKNSEFFIRGRRWDKDPQQHLSRKTGLLRQLEQENADDYDDIDGSAAALGIVCRTPSPEPVQPQSQYQYQHQQHQQTVSYQPGPSDVSLVSPIFTDGALPSPSATALTSDSGRTVDWSMVNPWAPSADDDVQASGSYHSDTYRYPDFPEEDGTDHQEYPPHGPAGLSDGYASWGDGAQWDTRQ